MLTSLHPQWVSSRRRLRTSVTMDWFRWYHVEGSRHGHGLPGHRSMENPVPHRQLQLPDLDQSTAMLAPLKTIKFPCLLSLYLCGNGIESLEGFHCLQCLSSSSCSYVRDADSANNHILRIFDLCKGHYPSLNRLFISRCWCTQVKTRSSTFPPSIAVASKSNRSHSR